MLRSQREYSRQEETAAVTIRCGYIPQHFKKSQEAQGILIYGYMPIVKISVVKFQYMNSD